MAKSSDGSQKIMDPVLTPSMVSSEPVSPSEPIIEETTPVEPTIEAPAESLYDLPDGRKVDAATLQKEWKENFLPDYTRKSQKLAEVERSFTKPEDNIPDWKRPDYVPKTYEEVIERGAELALQRLQEQAQAEETHTREVTAAVDSQIASLRTKDPKLDENALFVHANKYGFRDLSHAYENMKHIKQIELDTEQRVLKNQKLRADPVAGGGGATIPDGSVTPTAHRNYGSALEFLQRIKK